MTQSLVRRGTGVLFALALVAAPAVAQQPAPQGPQWLNADTSKKVNQSNFRALDEWPTANEYRTGSGSPGPKYWQQQVDYLVRTSLDTASHKVTGTERITYHNNSPDQLGYLWFQLDQDIDKADSRAAAAARALPKTINPAARRFLFPEEITDPGYTITRVQLVDAKGKKTDAKTYRNGTQLRVDLAEPLATGKVAMVEIDWSYPVPERGRNGRGGREKLKDGWLYEIAQWFPRPCMTTTTGGRTSSSTGRGSSTSSSATTT
jgi:hypothetical protein